MAISGSAVLVGSGIVSVCSVYSRWSGWSEDCRDKSPHPPRHCVGGSFVVVVPTEQGIGVTQKSGIGICQLANGANCSPPEDR